MTFTTEVFVPGIDLLEILPDIGSYVVASIVDEPDGTEVTGTAYLVAALGRGEFSGFSDNIAILTITRGWIFIPPSRGITVYVLDLSETLNYNGSAWTVAIPAYVIPQMFGAKADGVTDDTAAIQAAANAAASQKIPLYIPGTSASYVTSDEVDIPTKLMVRGAGRSSYIKQTNLTKSIFAASSSTGIMICDLKLGYATGTSATASIGGISLSSVANSTIARVEFDHMIWSGVYVSGTGATNNLITDIYVHDTQGTGGDTSDVAFTDNASYNTIQFSRLFGGVLSSVAVLIQDRAGGTIAVGNQVLYNNIDTHYTYGVLAGYQRTAGANAYTKVIGNTIQNITGTGNAGTSGSGIFFQSSGGIEVRNNIIINTCTSTVSGENLPAAISASNDILYPLLDPCTIIGNEITTSNWYGIGVSLLRVIVEGNCVTHNGVDANSYGMRLSDLHPGCVIANNSSKMTDATALHQAIIVLTSVQAITNLTVSNNVAISGTNGAALDIVGTASFGITGTVTGNSASALGAAGQGIRLQYFSGAFNGNTMAGASVGLLLVNVTNIRGAGNISSSSTRTVITQGTNANGFFDQSNDFGYTISASLINNSVSGVTFEFRGSSAPASGTYQITDRVVQNAAAIGSPKGWTCTTAGTPGTFTSEGNL